MQPKLTAPKIYPAPFDSLEEPKPSPSRPSIPRNLVIATGVNGLMVLAAIGMGWSTVRLYQRVGEAQQEVSRQANQFASELEQLRTDVVLTSSENSVFLKVLLLKPGIDKGLARDIAHSLVIRAREHHRDPDLVLALLDVESNFNPNAISPMGALGLGQVMPIWKKSLGIECDLHSVDCNINYSLKILGSYQQTYGSLELALTVYNRGPVGVNLDMRAGHTPFNGYADNVMRTYSRIKTWTRP